MTHAFFKALLFLGSGSVIHAMGGEQDMRKMGGLRKHMPVTYWTFVIGAAAIAGAPPLAGFFSKDEILHAVAAEGRWALWATALLTAGLTAFYMVRAVLLTFHGEFRGTEEQRHHLHESPPVMTVPLVVLAVGAVVAGWVGIPALLSGGRDWNWFHHVLEPVVAVLPGGAEKHHVGIGLEVLLLVMALAVAFAGWWIARGAYGRGRGLETGRAWAARFPFVHRLLVHKYWVDELYDRAIVRPLVALSRFFWKGIDALLIDGSVTAAAAATELTGDVGRLSTTGNVRNYALYFFLGVLVLFWWVLL
jgi:NADH-quinone oxidoreductase subunit L